MARTLDEQVFDFDKVCPICKKTYIPAPQHVYRDQRPIIMGATSRSKAPLVCSYHCMRESERMADVGNRTKRKKHSQDDW